MYRLNVGKLLESNTLGKGGCEMRGERSGGCRLFSGIDTPHKDARVSWPPCPTEGWLSESSWGCMKASDLYRENQEFISGERPDKSKRGERAFKADETMWANALSWENGKRGMSGNHPVVSRPTRLVKGALHHPTNVSMNLSHGLKS